MRESQKEISLPTTYSNSDETPVRDLTKSFYDIDDAYGYRACAVLSYIYHNASKSKDNSFTISDVSKNIQLPPASLRLILIKMELKEIIKIKYKLGKSNVYSGTNKGIEMYMRSMTAFFKLANETSLVDDFFADT
jgi:hypothetical protein